MTATRDGRARRVCDVVVSAFALLAVSPLVLLIVLAILVTMGGPVLFRQRRSGWHGREFVILKFRTLRAPAHPGEPDRNRRTSVGALLRWTSLDELPQLVNILKGDMSIIGPRPTLPEQVRYYSARQRGRLAVRPGLTGWAQVCGRNALSWPERIELDLWYIERRGWRLDLRIVLRTIGILLRPRGVVGDGGVNPGFGPDQGGHARHVG
jgi:lipopolysaccharide/colanic/teichoic acid biosynthesis glycosyltransferase